MILATQVHSHNGQLLKPVEAVKRFALLGERKQGFEHLTISHQFVQGLLPTRIL